MKIIFFLFSTLISTIVIAENDYYYNCIEKAASKATNKESLFLMQQVCFHKSIAKKCRELKNDDGKIIKIDPLNNDISKSKKDNEPFIYEWKSLEPNREKSSRAICIESCQKESFFSRNFGECSTG